MACLGVEEFPVGGSGATCRRRRRPPESSPSKPARACPLARRAWLRPSRRAGQSQGRTGRRLPIHSARPGPSGGGPFRRRQRQPQPSSVSPGRRARRSPRRAAPGAPCKLHKSSAAGVSAVQASHKLRRRCPRRLWPASLRRFACPCAGQQRFRCPLPPAARWAPTPASKLELAAPVPPATTGLPWGGSGTRSAYCLRIASLADLATDAAASLTARATGRLGPRRVPGSMLALSAVRTVVSPIRTPLTMAS